MSDAIKSLLDTPLDDVESINAQMRALRDSTFQPLIANLTELHAGLVEMRSELPPISPAALEAIAAAAPTGYAIGAEMVRKARAVEVGLAALIALLEAPDDKARIAVLEMLDLAPGAGAAS